MYESKRVAIPPYSYAEIVANRLGKVHRTIEIGPLATWYHPDGREAGQHVDADVLVDVDEDGNVLGVEFLTNGTFLWDSYTDDNEEGGSE